MKRIDPRDLTKKVLECFETFLKDKGIVISSDEGEEDQVLSSEDKEVLEDDISILLEDTLPDPDMEDNSDELEEVWEY